MAELGLFSEDQNHPYSNITNDVQHHNHISPFPSTRAISPLLSRSRRPVASFAPVLPASSHFSTPQTENYPAVHPGSPAVIHHNNLILSSSPDEEPGGTSPVTRVVMNPVLPVTPLKQSPSAFPTVSVAPKMPLGCLTREIYDTVAELEIETAAAYASGIMGGESARVIELQRRIDHLIQETRLAALTPPVYVR